MIHNWLNLAITVPWMLLPVLVTVTVSAAANAAFYAAWTLNGSSCGAHAPGDGPICNSSS